MTIVQSKVKPERNDTDHANPALTALADHLAEELAREYVRLMEDAVSEHSMPLSAMESEGE